MLFIFQLQKRSYVRPLGYNNVRRMLSNRKYIGEYKFKDIVVENGIPAIIDKDLFEKVQRRIQTNTRAPATQKAKEKYLLSTKLFCGKCNAIMFVESGQATLTLFSKKGDKKKIQTIKNFNKYSTNNSLFIFIFLYFFH